MGFLDARVSPANLDTLTAAKIGAPGSATATALNATILEQVAPKANTSDVVPKWKAATAYATDQAAVNPEGDIVRAIAAHTSGVSYDATKWKLSTSYASAIPSSAAVQIQPAKARKTLLHTFQAGHGFVNQYSGGGTGNVNDTTNSPVIGTQHATVYPGSSTATDNLYRFDMTAVDFTGKDIAVLIKADDATKLGQTDFKLMTGPSFNNTWNATIPASLLESGRYVWVTLPFPTSKSGTPLRNSITGFQFNFKRSGTDPAGVHVQAIAAVPQPAAYTGGCVSFDLDDGYLSHYTMALPQLAKYGFPANVYPVVEQITTGTNAMSITQLQELQDTHGWMVGAHADTWAHHNIPLASQTPEELKASMKANREWLALNGLHGGDFFAYPGGYFDGNNVNIARQYYAVARSAGLGRETLPPSDFHKVKVVSVISTSTLASVQASVDAAISTNSHAILLFHDLKTSSATGVSWLASDFAALVAYVAGLGVPVKTASELMASF